MRLPSITTPLPTISRGVCLAHGLNTSGSRTVAKTRTAAFSTRVPPSAVAAGGVSRPVSGKGGPPPGGGGGAEGDDRRAGNAREEALAGAGERLAPSEGRRAP